MATEETKGAPLGAHRVEDRAMRSILRRSRASARAETKTPGKGDKATIAERRADVDQALGWLKKEMVRERDRQIGSNDGGVTGATFHRGEPGWEVASFRQMISESFVSRSNLRPDAPKTAFSASDSFFSSVSLIRRRCAKTTST